jgi:hypothetical protein
LSPGRAETRNSGTPPLFSDRPTSAPSSPIGLCACYRSIQLYSILLIGSPTDESVAPDLPPRLQASKVGPCRDTMEFLVRGDASSPGWTNAEKRGLILTRVAVILHERLGNWNRQLRPRLHDRPIRWFETRSRGDLDRLLTGLACPVVLIDLGRHPTEGLLDLDQVLHLAPDARVLVLDPEAHDHVAGLARELGATYVASGFVPPPFVASLMSRWIDLAERQIERDGWSRTAFPETETEPWAWLADYLADRHYLHTIATPTSRRPIAPSHVDDGPTQNIAIDPGKNP